MFGVWSTRRILRLIVFLKSNALKNIVIQTGRQIDSRMTAGLRRDQTPMLECGLCVLSGNFHRNRGDDHIEMFPLLVRSWLLIELAVSGCLR